MFISHLVDGVLVLNVYFPLCGWCVVLSVYFPPCGWCVVLSVYFPSCGWGVVPNVLFPVLWVECWYYVLISHRVDGV